MNIFEKLFQYGIRTSSYVMACNDINAQGQLTEQQYRDRITELTIHDSSDIAIEHLPVMYGYVIQEAFLTDKTGKNLFEHAKQKTIDFHTTNPYVLAVKAPEEEIEKIDPLTGNVKKKKGEKGELALQAFLEHKNDIAEGKISRKAMLKIISEAADLSKAGASTYYANFKREYNI